MCQVAHIRFISQALPGQIAGHVDVIVDQNDLLNLSFLKGLACRIL